MYGEHLGEYAKQVLFVLNEYGDESLSSFAI